MYSDACKKKGGTAMDVADDGQIGPQVANCASDTFCHTKARAIMKAIMNTTIVIKVVECHNMPLSQTRIVTSKSKLEYASELPLCEAAMISSDQIILCVKCLREAKCQNKAPSVYQGVTN